MHILNHEYKHIKKINTYYHVVNFSFDQESFIALVIENEEITSVVQCTDRHDQKEIDIPTYFGKGFSSKIYTLIYNQVEKKEL